MKISNARKYATEYTHSEEELTIGDPDAAGTSEATVQSRYNYNTLERLKVLQAACKGLHKVKVLIHHIEVFKGMEDVMIPVAIKNYKEITKLYSSYIDTSMGIEAQDEFEIQKVTIDKLMQLFIITPLMNKGLLHMLP